MKSKFWTVWLFLVIAALAYSQQVKPVPALSTADRVAIQACEKSKQEAQKQFQDAQQQELMILREFDAAHPGFTLNQQTFAVEAVKAVEPKKEK
jgi:hypothetical protein